MKLKALFAIFLLATTCVHADVRFKQDAEGPSYGPGQRYVPGPIINSPNRLIRYAPIINIETITRREQGVMQRQICGENVVPIQRQVPIVDREVNGAGAAVGAVLGAALGHGVSHGNAGATVVGGMVGAGIGATPTNRTVGYTTETVGYQQRNTCQIVNEPYDRDVVVGYLVTYEDNGERKTISTNVHPGTHVRLVTTTRTEM